MNETNSFGVCFSIRPQKGKLKTWAIYVRITVNKSRCDYSLRPLSSLKSFIQLNGHLPDVPTQAEVEKNGQDLGEMNRILLQKIEELTLYILEQEESMKKQEDRMSKL